jgi:hypothetical protein
MSVTHLTLRIPQLYSHRRSHFTASPAIHSRGFVTEQPYLITKQPAIPYLPYTILKIALMIVLMIRSRSAWNPCWIINMHRSSLTQLTLHVRRPLHVEPG